MGDERSSETDSLTDDPRVVAFFGERFEAVARFEALLRKHGVTRGLLGPRETERLWERHLLNSAAIVPFLSDGPVVDVGSGAGLPGLVVATMEPEREVILIEPMERRVAWLSEVVAILGLRGVQIIRARAEEVWGQVEAGSVMARAVAPVAKLVPWCGPLVSEGGSMLFLKGRSAEEEVKAARGVLTKTGFSAELLEAATLTGLEPTWVVRLTRGQSVGSGGR